MVGFRIGDTVAAKIFFYIEGIKGANAVLEDSASCFEDSHVGNGICAVAPHFACCEGL